MNPSFKFYYDFCTYNIVIVHPDVNKWLYLVPFSHVLDIKAPRFHSCNKINC